MKLSNIETSISDLCRNDVEWKALCECVNKITTGKLNANAQVENGQYPFFTCDEFPFKIDNYAFDTEAILISGNGSQVGHINYYHGKFNAYQRTYILSGFKHIIVKYLLHYLNGYLRKYILEKSRKGSVPYITLPMLENFPIPIPPLPIQEEIVNILDKFTSLEAELEAELEAGLEARTKQYEYYRNELLSFEGKDVEWKTLGEIAYIPNNRISSRTVDKTNYVGVDNLLQNKQGKTLSSYVPTTGNLIEFIKKDILIGNIRPYLKKIWLSNVKGGTNGDVVVIRLKETYIDKYDSRFLYFPLSSDTFFEYDMKFSKGTKMPRGDKEAILKFPIPIPPLPEQYRIVSILDKFDALVNDISVGLPAEIKARRKQYEYYREKLLTFKNINSN